MNGNSLEIVGLTYKKVFDYFSIAFKKNIFTTVSGPNNCGKTTLIRIIGGEIPTDNSVLIYRVRLEDIKVTELSTIIKTVIPTEITFTQNTVEEELNYQLNLELSKEDRKKIIKDISKKVKLTKISTKTVESLSEKEVIRLQLALSLINSPKILLIDDLTYHFDKKEVLELINAVKDICQEENITLIMATNDMNIALLSDYLYVINDSKIVIEGKPGEVLEKDNVLNKHGIELPFMMDLSVKLRDYDLIKEIELDMDRMVETLWK